MVGAGRSGPGRPGGGCRRHGAQRGAAHAVQGAARVGVGPAVVLVGILPRARRRDAPGWTVGRSPRTEEGPARLARVLRTRIGGVRVLEVGRGVHGRPCAYRPRRSRRDGDGDLRHHHVVQQGGAAKGGRSVGGCEFRGVPDRSDPRRVAAHSLLVGLGVPDQRARRPHRLDRGRDAGTRLTRCATSWH
jgi:hypothetical protein